MGGPAPELGSGRGAVAIRPATRVARPGTGSAIFRLGPEEFITPPGNSGLPKKNVTAATRKPLFLFGLSFLLRYAQRAFLPLLM